MLKRFCPYCGQPLSEGCDCARDAAGRSRTLSDAAEYEAELIEELEERSLAAAWQQDLIDMYRRER